MVCGPWVGEFGWELFCWQAQLRYLKQEKEIGRMTCFARSGHDLLYRDFASVEHFNPLGVSNEWKCVMSHTERERMPKTDFPAKNVMGRPKKFIKFGTESSENHFDVLIHARNRMVRSDDNWPIYKWRGLLSELSGLTIGCIGTKKEALDISGAVDLRGLPLESLSNVMASSSVLIGPSSGAMHFGSLCGCPQVVWSNKRATLNRYERPWNPFEVDAKVILDQSPSIKEVLAKLSL
tara:strand:- start:3583 stop:4290 length:708 start_codon:yes stop_codon:yes gene_type:complete